MTALPSNEALAKAIGKAIGARQIRLVKRHVLDDKLRKQRKAVSPDFDSVWHWVSEVVAERRTAQQRAVIAECFAKAVHDDQVLKRERTRLEVVPVVVEFEVAVPRS
jgi:hypothetical protein